MIRKVKFFVFSKRICTPFKDKNGFPTVLIIIYPYASIRLPTIRYPAARLRWTDDAEKMEKEIIVLFGFRGESLN